MRVVLTLVRMGSVLAHQSKERCSSRDGLKILRFKIALILF
jgi:hypothetical protein